MVSSRGLFPTSLWFWFLLFDAINRGLALPCDDGAFFKDDAGRCVDITKLQSLVDAQTQLAEFKSLVRDLSKELVEPRNNIASKQNELDMSNDLLETCLHTYDSIKSLTIEVQKEQYVHLATKSKPNELAWLACLNEHDSVKFSVRSPTVNDVLQCLNI